MLYLREINQANGDLVDRIVYCSEGCATNDEEWKDVGEAFHPQSYEVDYPEFCNVCGDSAGNALTTEGESYLMEMVRAPRGLTTDQMESLYKEYTDVIDREP